MSSDVATHLVVVVVVVDLIGATSSKIKAQS